MRERVASNLRWLHDKLVYLIEVVSLRAYLAAYAIVIVFFAICYSVGSYSGNGIATNIAPHSDVSFTTGLYFSIVTIASLGYGDWYPTGYSKPLACLEVLFGLAFMGVFISRITSRKLSYYVERLFTANARLELDRIAMEFATSKKKLASMLSAVSNAYLSTPESRAENAKGKLDVVEQINSGLTYLRSISTGFSDYLIIECGNSHFFKLVPVDTVLKIGREMDDGAFALGQLLIGMPQEAKLDVLNSLVRQTIAESLDAHKKICSVVQNSAKDSRIVDCFRRVLDTCNRVPEGYFAVPNDIGAGQLPDQALQGVDEPVLVEPNIAQQPAPLVRSSGAGSEEEIP